jgi:hypothetical protein
MSYRIADLETEAEYLLTRAEWADARAAYYRATGAARDDAGLPPPLPPGHALLRRVTGVAPLGALAVGTSTVQFRLVLAAPADDRVVATADLLRGEEVYPEPEDGVVAATANIDPRTLATTLTPDPRAWVGRWVVRGAGGGPWALPPPAVGWKETLWGRSVAVAFAPALAVAGPFRGPNRLEAFEGGGTDVVLVRRDHPVIPREVLERQRDGADVADGNGVIRTPVRSRALLYVDGPGHGSIRRPEGLTGLLYRRASEGDFGRLVESLEGIARQAVGTVRAATRAVADADWGTLRAAGAAAVASLVVGPAALTLLGSRDPWRDAARLGAVHYAFAWSPLTDLERHRTATGGIVEPVGGSASAAEALVDRPVRFGVQDLAAPRYAVGPLAATADDLAAAEVWATRLTALAPETAQRTLEELARKGAFMDLIMARLVVEAQKDAEKRAALKADLAVRQAEFWREYGQYIAKGLSAVLSVAGTPAAGAALYTILSFLYQAGIAVQGLEVKLEAAHRAELDAERRLRALEAELARLEADLAARAKGAPAPPEVKEAPAAPPARRRGYWFDWILEVFK